MHITQDRAMHIAKALGYKGDAAGVAKWLADADQTIKIKEAAEPISTKALLVNQGDAKSVTVTQIDDEAPAEESYAASAKKAAKTLTADDVDAIVKSRIDDVAKQFAARPTLEVTGGESVEHAIYNANKTKAFSNARNAELFMAGVALSPDVAKNLAKSNDGRDILSKSTEIIKKYAPNVYKDYSTGVGSLDALTLPGVNTDVIRLFNEYGDVAEFANVITGNNDQEIQRYRNMTERRAVTYPNENVQPSSAADSDWKSYTMRFRMAMSLTRVSLSSVKFSRIAIADEVARDFAQDFMAAEDDAALNGNGTSTYGGLIGLAGQFANVGLASARGAVNANNWAAYSLTTFQTIKGRLPRYAYRRGNGPVWFTTQEFYETVMMPIARSAGGVTASEIANFNEAKFLGHPVQTTPLMNTNTDTGSTATIDCYFGNFGIGLDLGRGSGMAVDVDNSAGFTTASSFIRGLFWHSVQAAHGVGTATVAGPIVCGYQS